MPGTGKPFSVEESNFGALGWVSDKSGYRYQPTHPVTGEALAGNSRGAAGDCGTRSTATPPPECCLVNLYRAGAKMGLHQDRDEKDVSAAVIGVSLGDEALFRIGGNATTGRGADPQRHLASGDVIAFGGAARLAYHGIDRIRPGTSRLVARRRAG